jgi:putative redox protein
MTLTLYAQRKGWSLEGIKIELSHERVHSKDSADSEDKQDARVDLIRRYIIVKGILDHGQLRRLLEIAQRCPMHRTLASGPTIVDEIDLAT